MASAQTQVFLTATQQERLSALARREGRSLAELVHEAIDAYLSHASPAAQAALEATFGVAPAYQGPSRVEWDRLT